MEKRANRPATGPSVPPPQHSFQDAASLALEAVANNPPEQLEWLGARKDGHRWVLGVLNESLTVDLTDGIVRTSSGQPTGPWWRILTLHYLAVSIRPLDEPPSITFADTTAGMGYADVYRMRVIDRLCRTVGSCQAALGPAAEAIGGVAATGGDLTFDFRVYPRVRLRLVWHAPDEEFGPSATLLLPANIESFFCVEDTVVLSERLISRLSGGRF